LLLLVNTFKKNIVFHFTGINAHLTHAVCNSIWQRP